jgi:hypothetical protein
VAYGVQAGRSVVSIGDGPPLEDPRGRAPYVVPVSSSHRFEVLEPATVLEAISAVTV